MNGLSDVLIKIKKSLTRFLRGILGLLHSFSVRFICRAPVNVHKLLLELKAKFSRESKIDLM